APANGTTPQAAAPPPAAVADMPSPPAAERAPEAADASPSDAAPAQPAPAAGAGDLDSVYALWPAVVDLVRSENALLGALIAEARPVAAQEEDLTLAFSATAQFLKKKAEDPANRMIVGEALRSITGTRWRLSYELREESAEELGGRGSGSAEHSEEEWVRRFVEEFDAEEIAGEWDEAGAAAEQHGERDAPAVTSNEKGA
ncbi:MAG TPA: hypothetical protein VF380_03605, partial [Solirubrobacteraceae bacterium]